MYIGCGFQFTMLTDPESQIVVQTWLIFKEFIGGRLHIIWTTFCSFQMQTFKSEF